MFLLKCSPLFLVVPNIGNCAFSEKKDRVNKQVAVVNIKSIRKKEQAIANLLQMPTIAEAAEATGIAEITMRRWLRDTDFTVSYRQARRQVVDSAIGCLQQAVADAVNVLVSIMNDKASPAGSRVTAARVVIDMGLKAVELQDLEERIYALEEQAEYEGI